ncbi:Uncharacterized protein BM_BM574 [Brugia malayi]|uniref:Bm574 n=1 Tax=Brugia malayi TaxID=6279 RepID=A0A4E9FCG5_BRUMA|nr:Uncharacterized protein BM_BM574 [Brugia malayi]VIO93889.1 Uncharacterized protein BM_BM574 [Brugia malayi]
MGQKDGLLLNSDDSDIPDLDLPTANVRKERSRLFSRARQNAETVIVRQQNCSVQIALILLFSAVVIAIAFLGFFTSYFSSQLEQLRSTPTWNASSLLYTRLEHIESQINGIADKIQEKLSDHLENDTLNLISERVNAVADACIQGCQTVSKLVVSNNGTKYTLDSVSDKLKKKRSKVPQWSSIRDTPIVFTRAKHV